MNWKLQPFFGFFKSVFDAGCSGTLFGSRRCHPHSFQSLPRSVLVPFRIPLQWLFMACEASCQMVGDHCGLRWVSWICMDLLSKVIWLVFPTIKKPSFKGMTYLAYFFGVWNVQGIWFSQALPTAKWIWPSVWTLEQLWRKAWWSCGKIPGGISTLTTSWTPPFRTFCLFWLYAFFEVPPWSQEHKTIAMLFFCPHFD